MKKEFAPGETGVIKDEILDAVLKYYDRIQAIAKEHDISYRIPELVGFEFIFSGSLGTRLGDARDMEEFIHALGSGIEFALGTHDAMKEDEHKGD